MASQYDKDQPACARRSPRSWHSAPLNFRHSLRGCLRGLIDDWRQLDGRIKDLTTQIETLANEDENCRRLMGMPGVGPLIASAMVAAIGNGAAFIKGRDFAAWLGLVPRQHSTRGKSKLLGISKRGNPYLRRLFIH